MCLSVLSLCGKVRAGEDLFVSAKSFRKSASGG